MVGHLAELQLSHLDRTPGKPWPSGRRPYWIDHLEDHLLNRTFSKPLGRTLGDYAGLLSGHLTGLLVGLLGGFLSRVSSHLYRSPGRPRARYVVHRSIGGTAWLKGTLAWDFLPSGFFFSIVPTWSSDSYLKLFSNINSKLPSYLNTRNSFWCCKDMVLRFTHIYAVFWSSDPLKATTRSWRTKFSQILFGRLCHMCCVTKCIFTGSGECNCTPLLNTQNETLRFYRISEIT